MQQNNRTTIDSPLSEKGNKQSQTTSNTIQVLKLELQLSRMKKIMDMKAEFRKNKEEYNQLSEEINQVSQQIKQKKKQIISQKLLKWNLQQEKRLNKNKQANQVLFKIKEQRQERRRRMESLVSQYKQEYQQVYQKKLSQRKSNLQLKPKYDSDSVYVKLIHKDNKNRVKTESLDEGRQRNRRQKSFFDQLKEQKQEMAIKKQKIMQLVNKRIEYGKKAQENSLKIKIPRELIDQAKFFVNKGGYDKNIDKYKIQQNKHKKAKLDTNFSGDIHRNKQYEIDKIVRADSPTEAKLSRLRYIVDGFNEQYTNNRQSQVLDLMCKASIERANLLLKQS